MAKPQRTLRSETIKRALKNHFVVPIADRYLVLAFRCLWECEKDERSLTHFQR